MTKDEILMFLESMNHRNFATKMKQTSLKPTNQHFCCVFCCFKIKPVFLLFFKDLLANDPSQQQPRFPASRLSSLQRDADDSPPGRRGGSRMRLPGGFRRGSGE